MMLQQLQQFQQQLASSQAQKRKRGAAIGAAAEAAAVAAAAQPEVDDDEAEEDADADADEDDDDELVEASDEVAGSGHLRHSAAADGAQSPSLLTAGAALENAFHKFAGAKQKALAQIAKRSKIEVTKSLELAKGSVAEAEAGARAGPKPSTTRIADYDNLKALSIEVKSVKEHETQIKEQGKAHVDDEMRKLRDLTAKLKRKLDAVGGETYEQIFGLQAAFDDTRRKAVKKQKAAKAISPAGSPPTTAVRPSATPLAPRGRAPPRSPAPRPPPSRQRARAARARWPCRRRRKTCHR